MEFSQIGKEPSNPSVNWRNRPDTDSKGRRPLRLLIVEDYDGLRKSLQLYFEYLGYLVATADSYTTAIREADLTAPDVVICDWHINSRRDGTAVAREIHKRHGSTIIFISASSIARLRQATPDILAAHYFSKPVSPGKVAKIIKSIEQGIL